MPKMTTLEQVSVANSILARVTDFDCVTVTLAAAAVTADANGQKILKAGTLLGSATAGKTVLADHAAAQPDNSAASEGVLFYDLDLTGGDREAAMLYKGTVALARLPAAPTHPEALPRITFVKD